MRLRLGAAITAVALLAGGAGAAQASVQYAVSSYELGPVLDSFRAFDTSLGTLKSVSFDITYSFLPLIISDSSGQIYPLFVQRSIDGLGRGYDTSLTPPFRVGSIVTTAPGEPAAPVAAILRETFTFNEISELVGFSVSSSGALLTARLSDFFPGGPFGDVIVEKATYSAYAINTNTGATMISAFTSASGGGLVTYAYEPFPPGSGGVPEPASWALMILGLAVAGASLRRVRAFA